MGYDDHRNPLKFLAGHRDLTFDHLDILLLPDYSLQGFIVNHGALAAYCLAEGMT